MELITSVAALLTAIAALVSSLAALRTGRETLRQVRAQAEKVRAETDDIQSVQLGRIINYWKELAESLAGRVASLEDQTGRYRQAFDYVVDIVATDHPEVVKIARDIWYGRITQGTG